MALSMPCSLPGLCDYSCSLKEQIKHVKCVLLTFLDRHLFVMAEQVSRKAFQRYIINKACMTHMCALSMSGLHVVKCTQAKLP